MGDVLAVIGGSGLYNVDDLTDIEEIEVDTPYGKPSDYVIVGRYKESGAKMMFLPRHGRGHRISPSEINYRANICALKKLGATHVLSVSAVGSMREEIAPGDLVIVDQFIDLTKRRTSTFFEAGIVGHVAFSHPICPIMARAAFDATKAVGARSHMGGTYVCIEGPQFSTRAESLVYRGWGVHVIGMTNMPEAKLAREAQLPYATVALSTDYDCWHESEAPVTVEMVIATLRSNVQYARAVAKHLAANLPDVSKSPAKTALENAVMTAPERIPTEARERLSWLLPDLTKSA